MSGPQTLVVVPSAPSNKAEVLADAANPLNAGVIELTGPTPVGAPDPSDPPTEASAGPTEEVTIEEIESKVRAAGLGSTGIPLSSPPPKACLPLIYTDSRSRTLTRRTSSGPSITTWRWRGSISCGKSQAPPCWPSR